MSIGQGNISFSSPPGGGGPNTPLGAHNGTSLDIPKFVVLGQDEGAAGDPAKFLSNRQLPMQGFYLRYSQSAAGEYLRIDNPAPAFTGKVPWQQETQSVLNSDGTTYNTPMIMGWNPFRTFDPTQPGQHLSMEPYFVTGGVGGALLKELHYQVDYPDGEEVRLFSSTLTVRPTMIGSDARWDWRAVTHRCADLIDTDLSTLSTTAQGPTGQTTYQVIGAIPVFKLNSRTHNVVISLQNTEASLTMSATPSPLPFQVLGSDASEDFLISTAVVNNTSRRINWIDDTGVPQWQIFVGDRLRGASQANDFAIIDGPTGQWPIRIKQASGNVMINGVGMADNGAALQVYGNVTTDNPGTGVGKWLLGQEHAGAVTPDANRFLEVNVDGVVYKVIIST